MEMLFPRLECLDTSAGTITVQDLVAKKPITVRITPESQLRKLPPPMAQRIAARLKGSSADAQPPAAAQGGAGSAASADQSPKLGRPPSGGSGAIGKSGGRGTADLHQMINRMP